MSAENDPMIGQILGQYEIESRLGEGGMASVYLAHQRSIGRQVAIKLLPAHFLHDPTFLKRFQREVQIIAHLQHARILPVYDYGDFEGQPYIVMAYMMGGTLADRMKRGPMPLAEVVGYIEQIAEGLDYAHAEGIIHRDFKPSNVLLDRANNVYLADFGIAKLSENNTALTATGVIGTPAYMAPEMASDGKTGSLSDIYALGVGVYQMLSGRLPFEGDTPLRQMMAHISDEIPDIRTIRPDLPSAASEALRTAMAKDPAQRYQTARAFAAALRAAASAQPLGSDEAVYSTMPSMQGGRGRTADGISVAPPTALKKKQTGEATMLETPAAGQRPAPRAARSGTAARSLLPVIIGGVVVLLIAVIGGGALLLSMKGGANPTQQALVTDRPTATASSTPDAAGTAAASGATQTAAAILVAEQGSENATSTAVMQQATEAMQITQTQAAQAALDATATSVANADATLALDRQATINAQSAVFQEALDSVLKGAYEQNVLALVQSIEPMTNTIDYGPQTIQIKHEVNTLPNIVNPTDRAYRNFMVKAVFTNPYRGLLGVWDFGMVFRSTDRDNEYRLRFDAGGSWGLEGRKGGPVTGLYSGTTGWLHTEENGQNTLTLIVIDERAYIVLNDHFQRKVDIFNLNEVGGFGVGVGFSSGHQLANASTPVEVTIWRLP